MSIVIQVSNLSKIYRLGEIGTGTLSRDLERWYKMRIRGQEDPFLKIGEVNERNKKGEGDVVYALREINFEVNQGEALGIIGKNGAGKSTLLKIISRVTSPTKGKIKIKGRVASLLEVGTGFHPELTGRENIYLNGAILGMRKKEITRKLDEIINFSGVERYINTPVKRYSSGMYVRLAFAVAAHLESEILIVDEVLAVGDAEFQKKCLGKMDAIRKGEGRTVIFVSHNMGAVRALCSNCMLLRDGIIEMISATNNIIEKYLSLSNLSHEGKYDLRNAERSSKYSPQTVITEAWLEDKTGRIINEYFMGTPIKLYIKLELKEKIKNAQIGFCLSNSFGETISYYTNLHSNKYFKTLDSCTVCFDFSSIALMPGNYFFDLMIYENIEQYLDMISNALPFKVIPFKEDGNVVVMSYGGVFYNPPEDIYIIE